MTNDTVPAPMRATRRAGGWQAALLLAGSCMPVMGSVLITPILPQLSQKFGDQPGGEILVPMIVAIPALLIAIFAQKSGTRPDGKTVKHYYVPESVGIATGFLIAALHDAGLATLTHTPSPMGFLNEICSRPAWEKPTILLVVGYPRADCRVPVHGGLRKELSEISSWI